MSINAFALAPAGVFGSGSIDARPYACAGIRPSLLGTGLSGGGTRLPVAGAAPRVRVAFDVRTARAQAMARTAINTDLDRKHTAQNDGTTLGLPSSRRPPS